MPSRKYHGLTLIELMITLAVATLVLTAGVPALQQLFASSRAHSAVTTLYQDLNYARQMAIAYQATVTLCPLSSSSHCNGQWQQGYQIFIDTPPWQSYGGDDAPLKLQPPISSRDAIKYSANVNAIRFDEAGFTGQNGTFYYCPDSDTASYLTAVVISRTGRIRHHTLATPVSCQ
ncbi:type IV fimbrial biogenesis protein FimT [Ferrimonas sediminum]|uniref:Type II secretion system protein H n=1 Tax=Ferrimonas sediminum TaxID=718193 RepID=A0A1G8ZC97_9GAMM|nr:GspH/FimT family pseudopilin [Ferrimonas sediminum]SDK12719.1 type IV fimbrial biogenesis protein FimT [Ferrimonas sediminum]